MCPLDIKIRLNIIPIMITMDSIAVATVERKYPEKISLPLPGASVIAENEKDPNGISINKRKIRLYTATKIIKPAPIIISAPST